MSDLHHECGLVAIYHLPTAETSPLAPAQGQEEVSRLVPRMLLDIQNRGQLSAGMTVWNPARSSLLATYKEVGSVSEVFRMSHRGKYESLMEQHAGRAAIGHVRYATCGAEDRAYAQPLERPHIQKRKWFAFGFNGQLANYPELRAEILAADDTHLARDNDTEVLMHAIGRELSGDANPTPVELLAAISRRFDGAWNIALLDACGRLIVARDPLGIRPMEYARLGPLVAAASESVALLNLGFPAESIHSLEPGTALVVDGATVRVERFADSPRRAHCFFEWIYFANVASTMDERSVYLTRKRLGEELARLETVPIDEDTVVVPVPDTSKAAADAMAYRLRIPSVEIHAAPRGAGGEAGDPRGGFDRAEHHHEGAPGADAVAGPGPRDPRPGRLSADRGAVLLRHRHVDDRRAVRAGVSPWRAAHRGRAGGNGGPAGGRFAPLSARRGGGPVDRLRRGGPVRGLPHGPLSDAGRRAALRDRRQPSVPRRRRPYIRGGDVGRQW
ncbi:MAG: hypothetical protein LW698_15165 [Planctomycetaceae bacterium]|nr:hypothetical protein [Planctomycetaceae bacterium]